MCILSSYEVIPTIMQTKENEKFLLVIEKHNNEIS